MYMHDDSEGHLRGTTVKRGYEGQWKIIKFKDNRFMLSPRKWPNSFIYMDSSAQGLVKGWNGDPGTQGHWLISYM